MNILLAVSGSIAAYKSYDLARLFVKAGHQVRVVLTEGALEFIKPETFRYIGIEDVYLPTDDFDPKNLKPKATVLHIELSKWADRVLIAPASAHTIAKLSLGLNNDLLGSLFLALPLKPVIIFPAMNTFMWNDPGTQEHVKKLNEKKHVSVINPISGLLACGDVGAGKFPEVDAVKALGETMNPLNVKNKKVIITAGATASPLDPVRYLTNPSSGKMGIAIAKSFLEAGYDVTVLAGHNCSDEVTHLLGHPRFELKRTPTTELMKVAAMDVFPKADLYISTGAIADIEFDVASEKLKKEQMTDAIPFRKAADILGEVLKVRKHQKVVSFAAETQTTKEVFQEKMNRKPVDLMVGNKVSNGLIGSGEVQGFQKNEGEYFFVKKDSINGPYPLSKLELGRKLVGWFEGKDL